jgi:hypothetical protein
MTYPPAPWRMHAQMWLSLFRVPGPAGLAAGGRPGGTYGVALVRYDEPSPLTYHELLVAHPVRSPVKGVSIDQIWVDSAASMAGGRELWAIPKELCDFDAESVRTGPVTRTTWSATLGQQPIVEASFADLSRAAPRLPFKGATWQPGIDGGPDRTARLTGSSRTRCPAARGGTSPPTAPSGGSPVGGRWRRSGCLTRR